MKYFATGRIQSVTGAGQLPVDPALDGADPPVAAVTQERHIGRLGLTQAVRIGAGAWQLLPNTLQSGDTGRPFFFTVPWMNPPSGGERKDTFRKGNWGKPSARQRPCIPHQTDRYRARLRSAIATLRASMPQAEKSNQKSTTLL